jgi:hypothetical protein
VINLDIIYKGNNKDTRMENNIKIVRLTTGEDIICNIENNSGNSSFKMIEPMSVGIHESRNQMGLVMRHWLPVQLIKKNEVTIVAKDILTVFEPNEDLKEYYLNTVEKIANLLKAKNVADELTEDEANHIMEAISELQEGRILH